MLGIYHFQFRHMMALNRALLGPFDHSSQLIGQNLPVFTHFIGGAAKSNRQCKTLELWYSCRATVVRTRKVYWVAAVKKTIQPCNSTSISIMESSTERTSPTTESTNNTNNGTEPFTGNHCRFWHWSLSSAAEPMNITVCQQCQGHLQMQLLIEIQHPRQWTDLCHVRP